MNRDLIRVKMGVRSLNLAWTTLSVTNHKLLDPKVIVLKVTPGTSSMRAETGFIDSGLISLPFGS